MAQHDYGNFSQAEFAGRQSRAWPVMISSPAPTRIGFVQFEQRPSQRPRFRRNGQKECTAITQPSSHRVNRVPVPAG
jgi:hypothetical protein